jgi:hypothetical protein
MVGTIEGAAVTIVSALRVSDTNIPTTIRGVDVCCQSCVCAERSRIGKYARVHIVPEPEEVVGGCELVVVVGRISGGTIVVERGCIGQKFEARLGRFESLGEVLLDEFEAVEEGAWRVGGGGGLLGDG